MPALLLASTSPYKRELLARLGLVFEVCAPGVDETLAPGEAPRAAALRLARAKACAVAETHPRALVLAGDQLAALADEPIGKPRGAGEAQRRLEQMAGHTITYYTAIALSAPNAQRPAVFVDASRVRLRSLTAQEISRYVAHEKPFDCAGGLKLESLGSALCEHIDTHDPTALIGLPLIAVARLLREQGQALP